MTFPAKSTLLKSKRGLKAWRHGRYAEAACLLRLWLTGWRVIGHRLAGKRGTGIGEVDIVAARGNILAFIEVKARASTADALESIQAQQRARIQAAAAAFLARHPQFAHLTVRFDAMISGGILWPKHVPDAWRLS
ncbi:MAG: YraN family protein [Rhodospirillaceae bacterium]|nr:YraN family protein [Rhodospirillaceae bacterium]